MDISLISNIDVLWPEPEMAPHLGLLILRDILKERYEVEYVDFKLLDEVVEALKEKSTDEAMQYLAAYILRKKPKVVGFYTIGNTFVFTVQVAAHIKAMDADVKIVFGGPHASVTAKSCMEHLGFLDAICLGESERSIQPLMDALILGGDLSAVPGVTYREGNRIVTTQPAELLRDEELGSYTVFDYSPFPMEPTRTVALEGGRGCPYGCTFCSTSTFWGRRFRLKPLEVLLNEMDRFNELYGISSFGIQHDHFTADKQRAREFCLRLIESGRGYRWSCSARADSLDDELLDLMKESHCFALYLGIETGSDRMQRVIKKNLKVKDALETFRKAHERGIRTKVSFIYGFAEETEEDFLETLAMIESIYRMGNRLIQLHPYNVTPATEETQRIKDKLYFDRDAVLDYSLYNKNLFSEECLHLIEQYPDLFEQYYTFDTTVRKKYQYMDTLIHVIIFLFPFCRQSIERLLDIYGLAGLYLKYEGLLKSLREKVDAIAAVQRDTTDDLRMVYEAFGRFQQQEVDELGDPGFTELCRYERYLVEFAIEKTGKPVVHEFELDMEELLENGAVIPAQCNLLYFFKNGQILTTKCSSLLDILNL